MIYLTYNDQPSGVFTSQVCDVCRYMNSELNAGIRLVAFISVRGFSGNRKKLQQEFPGAWVLPALPKASYWQFSALVFALICLFTGERKVIARNILATHIALFAKKLGLARVVCLDGRGAIAAEWNEYQVVPNESMKRAIAGQEGKAVLETDFRIAVSGKLVDYWKEFYGYESGRHVIIPCTLGLNFRPALPPEPEIAAIRKHFGYDAGDIVMVYSGSTAGWQSFNVLASILGKVLAAGKNYKLLFLSGEDDNIRSMMKQFPGQVECRWLKHSEVQKMLLACDYGILYRENSITNRVASPTKFAEYLSAGLPVIISENLGDYTGFVEKEKCGVVVKGDRMELPTPVTHAMKQHCIELASKYFTKSANKDQYARLLGGMKGEGV